MEYRCNVALEELCPVCGDKVSGYHYGLLTCESCKGFFKRTVQNNKKYICVENQQCRIDKTQRKRCPFCRFQKCLHVGMRLEAVRADRMRGGRNKFGPMYKRDRALKQQRRALIQASGFRVESSSSLISSTHHGISCPSPSLSSPLPFSSPGANQYQCTSFSNWTIKSEQIKNCASLLGSTARGGSDMVYARPFSAKGPRLPHLVIEFMRCDPDELQLQNKITARLLQEQMDRDNQGSYSTFSQMCFMADQMLFSIVEWARTSIFFKQLKITNFLTRVEEEIPFSDEEQIHAKLTTFPTITVVSDQMKLLHSCWSDLLLLDIISRQVLYGREGSLLLVTGQEMELSELASQASPALANLVQRGKELLEKLQILKVDRQEFACIKFLILFNPDVKQLEDHQYIESVQEQVEGALLEYTLCTSSHLLGRFAHLLLCLSEFRSLGTLAEDHLYCKHLSGEGPCNSLLFEMLHAKHSLA